MKKILWHSNAGHYPTGYGNQTALFTPLIKKSEGFDVMVSAFCGIDGGIRINRHGIVELPKLRESYGNDVIEAHVGFHGIDAVVTLIDPFVLTGDYWQVGNVAMWSPIDCTPVSPENWDVLKGVRRVWSMSRFGHNELLKMGVDESQLDYVPHGVDTELFRPVNRVEARQKMARHLGVEIGDETFVVVTNAANKGTPSRKNFVAMLRAFKAFEAQYPDSLFYMHTEPTGRLSWGDDLYYLVESMGLTGKVIFPPMYNYQLGFIDGEMLNDIYNMGDVFLLLSYGEGFGIPIIEAQAAGLPVIVTNGSAMTELAGVGYRVKARMVQALQGRLGCYWWDADIDDAVWALGLAKAFKGSHPHEDNRRAKAREFALNYDYRLVWGEYMLPALNKLVGISDVLTGYSAEVTNVAMD